MKKKKNLPSFISFSISLINRRLVKKWEKKYLPISIQVFNPNYENVFFVLSFLSIINRRLVNNRNKQKELWEIVRTAMQTSLRVLGALQHVRTIVGVRHASPGRRLRENWFERGEIRAVKVVVKLLMLEGCEQNRGFGSTDCVCERERVG